MGNYTEFNQTEKTKAKIREPKNDVKPLTMDPTIKKQLIAKKKRLHRARKFKEWAMFTGYLLPSLAGVVIFFFLPLIMLLKTSVQRSSTNTEFVGMVNYSRTLSNEAFVKAAKNTMTFAAISVPLAVLLALLLALLLNSGLPGKSIFRSILLNPMMVPVASIVLIWQVFFSYNGVLNGWLADWFGSDPTDWLKSKDAQVVIMALFLWKNLGYNMVLFLAALNNIPGEILESATMDGAGAIKRFFAIKLHYLSPTIFFVAIMSLISSFKIFREVYLLTGDYPYDTLYMLQHFMNNAFTHLDYSKLSAGAISMCVVMIIVVGVLFFVEGKLDSNVEE